MSFKTREAKHPDDAKTMWDAWSWTFRHKPAEEPYEAPKGGEKWYLAEQDGSPVSVCLVIPYTVARGESDLSCGGVAGVATPPEHRKRGHGTRFMTDVLHAMREDGHQVAALYAFRDPFYAKVGYASCGWRWKIVCPAERIPNLKSELPVRQVAPEDVALFNEVYAPFARQLSGAFQRDEKEWTSRLGKNAPMLFAIGDPMEAYVWAKVTDFWGNVDVGECAWTTARGHEAVISLFRGLAHNQKTVTWCEPPESRSLALYCDRDVEFSMYRQTMFRVLDVPGAIARLRAEGKGEFTIQVRDHQIKGNDQCWKVQFSNGKAEAVPCKSADLNMGIGSFTQMFMGAPTLRELVRHGLVEVRSDDAVKAAERLFSPIQVCCMDFF